MSSPKITDAERWELWLKTLTLAGAIVAAFWTYHTYMETKEREFYGSFWNHKLDLFSKASEYAATMAIAPNSDVYRTARANYFELFYGRLSLVEGQDVKKAMQVFASHIPKEEPTTFPVSSLEQPAYILTLQLKQELGRSWKRPFDELNEKPQTEPGR